MRVTFHGVRGSFPRASSATSRYGWNTASACIESNGDGLILLDLGSGVQGVFPPAGLGGGKPVRATALVTHLHLDHVLGLPFLAPLQQAETRLDLYAPPQPDMTVAEALGRLVGPPFLPFRLADLPGEVNVREAGPAFEAAGASVIARPVPHLGPTFGYRVERGGASLVYVSDHQQPDSLGAVPASVLELCRDADLLIHDAQYTPEEFDRRPGWGHSTVAYAVEVARQAGARRLCLFHHDPDHSDDDVDHQLAVARELVRDGGPADVVAAYEGLTLEV